VNQLLFVALKNRIHDLRGTAPGYISALASGYLLMLSNILVQFALTPFYLKYLGDHQFGLLMIMLNMITFSAIGIGWMSGGLVRVFGEYWATSRYDRLRIASAVGKYVFTTYALFMAAVGIVVWLVSKGSASNHGAYLSSIILAISYLIVNYEALPERQAFVGTNQQATGNYIELVRTILFAVATFLLLPQLESMSAVWIALMCAVLLQRGINARYWKKRVGGMGWRRYTPEMKPILKRLAGRQGAGYIIYGALLLLLQADTIIIGLIGSSEAAGQFVLLWKIPEAIGLLLWRIPSAMEPRVIQLDVSGQHENLYGVFKSGRRWFSMLVVIVAFIYILTGHWLAEMWVGDHAPQERWMYVAGGFALLFSSSARWPIAFAHALIKLRGLIMMATVELISKLSLTVMLYPKVGIAAPLVAIIITHSFYVAWGYQRIMKCESNLRAAENDRGLVSGLDP